MGCGGLDMRCGGWGMGCGGLDMDWCGSDMGWCGLDIGCNFCFDISYRWVEVGYALLWHQLYMGWGGLCVALT